MGVLSVLVVNAGSSSLKLRLLDPGDCVVNSHDLPAPRGMADAGMVKDAISSFGKVDAVGHRIVHGGTLFRAPVVVDARVQQRLEALTDLAPLHQPKSLAALSAVHASLPDVPGVACFDTAFHATIPIMPPPSRCPPSGGHGGRCAGTGSTGCRTRTYRGVRRR